MSLVLISKINTSITYTCHLLVMLVLEWWWIIEEKLSLLKTIAPDDAIKENLNKDWKEEIITMVVVPPYLSITSWSNPTPHWFHHDLHRNPPPFPLFYPPLPYYAPFYPPTTSRNTTPLISPNRSPSGGGANSNLSDTDKRALCYALCLVSAFYRSLKFSDFGTSTKPGANI